MVAAVAVTSNGCTYARAVEQPPPPEPGPGLWLVEVCYANGVEVSRGAPFWDPGSLCQIAAGNLCEPPPDPRVLAQQAIASLAFSGPAIGTAPGQGSEGRWSGSRCGCGRSGRRRRRARRANGDGGWGVGDGDGAGVGCGLGHGRWGWGVMSPGGSYPAGGSPNPSPDCGYTYERASTNRVPGEGPWPITATSTWEVSWTGGGMTGAVSFELTSQGSMMIRELYVLNGD